MVESTIDLEQLDRHNYVVRPEYDPELEEIARQLGEVIILLTILDEQEVDH